MMSGLVECYSEKKDISRTKITNWCKAQMTIAITIFALILRIDDANSLIIQSLSDRRANQMFPSETEIKILTQISVSRQKHQLKVNEKSNRNKSSVLRFVDLH